MPICPSFGCPHVQYRWLAELRQRLVGWSVLFLLVCLITLPAFGDVIDPHRVYEQNCASCHNAHAGPFARQNLVSVGGVISAEKTGRNVLELLKNGHGRLGEPEIDALLRHFSVVLNRDALFQEKCRICHNRAVDLARLNLIVSDGKLTGRYSGRDIDHFLSYHGRLTELEAATILKMLVYQLQTATEPE